MNNFNLSSQWDEAIATYAYGKMGQLLLIFSAGWGNFYLYSWRGSDEGSCYLLNHGMISKTILSEGQCNSTVPVMIMSRWCKYTYSVGEMMQSYLL